MIWPVVKFSEGLTLVMKAVSDRFISAAILWYKSSLSSYWKHIHNTQTYVFCFEMQSLYSDYDWKKKIMFIQQIV